MVTEGTKFVSFDRVKKVPVERGDVLKGDPDKLSISKLVGERNS